MLTIVLDLDGTIVFPDEAEIAIPGRSRPTFISAETGDRLNRIGHRANLIIATARNGASVAGLCRALPEVAFGGFVLECGLVWRRRLADPFIQHHDREQLAICLRNHLIDWEHVPKYERMICTLAPSHIKDPQTHMQVLLREWNLEDQWQVHQERHKTFLYPQTLCKHSGLSRLGVDTIDIAAGDDIVYDRSFLEAARYPMCPQSSSEFLQTLVRGRDGFIGNREGHAAAHELLSRIEEMIDSDFS